MKTFGKIILGIIIIFAGIGIFSYVNGVAVHKAVGEQGDAAYLNKDLTFFKNRFEYHVDTPLFAEAIEFEISDEYLEENGLEEIEEKTVSFELYIFHSANATKQQGNYLTVLVKDLILPEEIKRETYLEMFFEYNVYKPKKEEPFNIVKIGKENWYLQWIKITLDNINGFTLKSGNLVLYNYDLEEPFLKAEDHDLIHLINKKDYLYNVVVNISDELIVLEDVLRDYAPGEEKSYELNLEIRLDGELKFKGDLYLSGEFNDWAIGNESYKLTKNKDDIYSTKINYGSGFNELYYTFTTLDGKVAVDKENNLKYYKYNYIDSEKDLSDYDIIKSEMVNFNQYSYYKWIAMGIYVGVLVIILAIIFFVTVMSNKKTQQNHIKVNSEEVKSDLEELENKNESFLE